MTIEFYSYRPFPFMRDMLIYMNDGCFWDDEDLNLNHYSVNLNFQNDANWKRLSMASQQIQLSSHKFQLGCKQ